MRCTSLSILVIAISTTTPFHTPAKAASLKTVYTFKGSPDGHGPAGNLAVLNGSLYGITYSGGPVDGKRPGAGTVYSIDLDTGAESILYGFSFGRGVAGGYDPIWGLGTDGSLLYGGTYGAKFKRHAELGAIYAVDPASGQETVLYYGGFLALTLKNGELYSLDRSGGNCGSLAATNLGTDETTQIYVFPGAPGGCDPESAMVFVGKLAYGETSGGLSSGPGYGTIYQFDPASGLVQTLYSFTNGDDGADPNYDLIADKGFLYGITAKGGVNGCNGGCGAVFKYEISSGMLTTLHTFLGGSDGAEPEGKLLLEHGKLYGTTFEGGFNRCGTVFEIDTTGKNYQILYKFTGASDGGSPQGGLVEYNGALYGTTSGYTASGQATNGTVFSITP
jgi:uncharacterized repeat protein (TIGR03803 family)